MNHDADNAIITLQDATEALEAAFMIHGSNDDSSHDIHHSRRVKANAFAIADMEGRGERLVLLAAAYLHDLVNLPKNSPDRARASQLSAEKAAPILRDLGFDAAMIAQIQHAIAAHSFSAGISPETVEASIFQDADRLEALGAIGIARTFYIAGKLGSTLFDGEDPFAARRDLDDKAYALDHFAVKLLKLPQSMRTQGGRALAEQRLATMTAFLAAMRQELG